jgi:hypothetical protein
VEEEHFKEGVWPTNWARGLKNQTNRELRELYETPDLVADIKRRKLE